MVHTTQVPSPKYVIEAAKAVVATCSYSQTAMPNIIDEVLCQRYAVPDASALNKALVDGGSSLRAREYIQPPGLMISSANMHAVRGASLLSIAWNNAILQSLPEYVQHSFALAAAYRSAVPAVCVPRNVQNFKVVNVLVDAAVRCGRAYPLLQGVLDDLRVGGWLRQALEIVLAESRRKERLIANLALPERQAGPDVEPLSQACSVCDDALPFRVIDLNRGSEECASFCPECYIKKHSGGGSVSNARLPGVVGSSNDAREGPDAKRRKSAAVETREAACQTAGGLVRSIYLVRLLEQRLGLAK